MTLKLTADEVARIRDDMTKHGEASYGIGGVTYRFGFTTSAHGVLGYKGSLFNGYSFAILCHPDRVVGKHGDDGPVTLTVEVG